MVVDAAEVAVPPCDHDPVQCDGKLIVLDTQKNTRDHFFSAAAAIGAAPASDLWEHLFVIFFSVHVHLIYGMGQTPAPPRSGQASSAPHLDGVIHMIDYRQTNSLN